MFQRFSPTRRTGAITAGAVVIVVLLAAFVLVWDHTGPRRVSATAGSGAAGGCINGLSLGSTAPSHLNGSCAAAQHSGEAFTFASIPDTQRELWNMTTIDKNFDGRLNWLAQEKTALNLKFVWQVGDLEDTDNLLCAAGTPPSQQGSCSRLASVNPRYIPRSAFDIDHFQYHWASQGLKILENAEVPFALTVGNHDTGAVCGGPACPVVAGQTQPTPVEVRDTATFNQYEPPSRFGLSDQQGTNSADTTGVFQAGRSDNAYRTFSAGGYKWLLINLELWPRTEVLHWANAVVSSHPHDNVIVTTHDYLTGGGQIAQTNGGYGSNSMQYVFDTFVKLHANIRFVFSGHVGNSDYRVDTGVNGNKIYDMMDTYHDTINNWVRLITIDPINKTVDTAVYAPLTNQTRPEPQANVHIANFDFVQ